MRGANTSGAEVVEIKNPGSVSTGRLRLVGFPGRQPPLSIERFDLELKTYRRTTALSFVGGSKKHNFGAVYDDEMALIPATQRAKPGRNWAPSPPVMPEPAEAQSLPGRTFFAGRHAVHFGHILLETLTRFWPSIDYDVYDHFLTIPSHGSGASSASNPLLEKLLRVARIPAEKLVVTLDQPLRCDELDVPSPPFKIADSADPRCLDVFDRIGARIERRRYGSDLSQFPDRIYLSRSHLQTKARSADKRSADNEVEVEDLMVRRGFEIVHPQERPIYEQVALARHADVIAGCDGSALHLGVFARPGARMLALDTRRVPNQFLINQARGLDAVHVWAATKEVDNRMATWAVALERAVAGLDLLLTEGGD